METQMKQEWYTVEELQRWLRLGRSKTYELIRTGEVPSYRLGRIVRIRRQDVETWLEQNRCVPVGHSVWNRNEKGESWK
jgi:excisionase family DNA binding protein